MHEVTCCFDGKTDPALNGVPKWWGWWCVVLVHIHMHSSTHSMGPSRDFSLWLVAVLCLVWAAGCEEVVGEGGVPWKEGRATYFDAPDYWKAEFQVGQFGDLHGNSCGYVNRQHGVEPSIDHLPFPIDGVTAVSDSMEYYKGTVLPCP